MFAVKNVLFLKQPLLQSHLLDSGIRGVLDVTVREENGEESKFSISTASLPQLNVKAMCSTQTSSG
ncbi:hypothetical protein PR729_08155 [Providencia rettgeri]|nr:hypothetical protein PR729_08155 [Providencia rettgeri]